MFKILFATDGSAPARAGLDFLARLPLAGTRVDILSVVPPSEDTFQQGWRAYELVRQAEQDRAEQLLAETAAALGATGAEITTQPRAGEAAHTILEAARQFEADLIVVGSHGHTGLRGFFLGSVARNVAHHAGCSVLIAREAGRRLQDVVFGTDGSPHAAAAESLLTRLPLPAESRITVVSAVRPFEPMASVIPAAAFGVEPMILEVRQVQEQGALGIAEKAAERLRAARKHALALSHAGDPATGLLDQAEALRAGLVAVGARGASLIEGLVVGSVAERVMKKAPCSVLIGR